MVVSDRSVTEALLFISKGKGQKALFFKELSSPDWIRPLLKHGYFTDPPKKIKYEDKSISYPIWPEAKYLLRMVDKDFDSVMCAIMVIPLTDNINVLTDLADIALKAPVDKASIIAGRAVDEKWIESIHGFLVRTRLHELVKKLVSEGETNAGYKLAREIIFKLPGCGDLREETEAINSDYHFDHSGDPDQYNYCKFIENVCPEISPPVGTDIFEDLCKALSKVVEISESSKDKPRQDYSYIKRPAIEDHKANIRSGVFNSLVNGVRDSGIRILEIEPEKLNDIFDVLRKQDWGIFVRLALFFLKEAHEESGAVLEEYLSNRRYYDHPNSRREFELAAKERFKSLTHERQAEILEWAKDVESKEKFMAWHKEFTSTEVDEAKYDKYKGQTIVRNLEPFKEFLRDDDRKLYDQLVDEYGPPITQDYLQYYSEAGWGGKSPKTSDDLLALPVGELIDTLKYWKSDDEIAGPSTLGLSRELTTAIGRDHNKFLPNVDEFKMPHKPWFVSAFFEGISEAAKAKKPINWEPVLNLAEWVMDQGLEITSPDYEEVLDMEKDWSWCRAAIVKMLKNGMNEATATGFNYEFEEQTWQILNPIATTQDSEREPRNTVDGEYDPHLSAINSTRGKAFEAMVEYGLWTYRLFKVKYEEKHGNTKGFEFSFEEVPKLKEAFDFHLKVEEEPSLQIRSLYGFWFPWLVTLDPDWAEQNAELIFPEGDDQIELYFAAWETYVIYNRPYINVFPILQSQYLRAIKDISKRKPRKRFGDEEPDKHLADHLITMYWWDWINLESDDGMLKLLYKHATPEIRTRIIWFSGNSLKDAPKPVKKEILNRAKSIWKHHLDTLDEDIQKHQEELSMFTWWFNSGAFDDDPKWVFDQQKQLLDLGVVPDFIPEVVNKLMDLVAENPLDCLEILEGLLKVGSGTIATFFWEFKAKEVMQIAVKDKSDPVQKKVRFLVTEFMDLRYFDFKEILDEVT